MPTREACHHDTAGVHVQPYGLPYGSLATLAPRLHALREAVMTRASQLHESAPHELTVAFQPLAERQAPPAGIGNAAAATAEPASPLDVLAWHLMRPCDALGTYEVHRRQSELERVLQKARELAEDVDRLVVLGSGVPQAALVAVFRSCCHPCHNELSLGERAGGPRLYFDGDHFDPEYRYGLFDLLADQPSALKEERWGLVVSSAGPRDEATHTALGQYLPRLMAACRTPEQLARRFVAAVRPGDWLHGEVAQRALPRPILLPPFSRLDSFGPATLLPLAAAGVDVVRYLRGAAAITERFRSTAVGLNPVLDLAGTGHLLTVEQGLRTRAVARSSMALADLSGWWDSFARAARAATGTAPLGGADTRFLATDAAAELVAGGEPAQLWQLVVETSRRGLNDRLAERIAADEQHLAAAAKAAGIPLVRLRLAKASEASLGQLMQLLPAVALCQQMLQTEQGS